MPILFAAVRGGKWNRLYEAIVEGDVFAWMVLVLVALIGSNAHGRPCLGSQPPIPTQFTLAESVAQIQR